MKIDLLENNSLEFNINDIFHDSLTLSVKVNTGLVNNIFLDENVLFSEIVSLMKYLIQFEKNKIKKEKQIILGDGTFSFKFIPKTRNEEPYILLRINTKQNYYLLFEIDYKSSIELLDYIVDVITDIDECDCGCCHDHE